jgi:hypothetical protein
MYSKLAYKTPEITLFGICSSKALIEQLSVHEGDIVCTRRLNILLKIAQSVSMQLNLHE